MRCPLCPTCRRSGSRACRRALVLGSSPGWHTEPSPPHMHTCQSRSCGIGDTRPGLLPLCLPSVGQVWPAGALAALDSQQRADVFPQILGPRSDGWLVLLTRSSLGCENRYWNGGEQTSADASARQGAARGAQGTSSGFTTLEAWCRGRETGLERGFVAWFCLRDIPKRTGPQRPGQRVLV